VLPRRRRVVDFERNVFDAVSVLPQFVIHPGLGSQWRIENKHRFVLPEYVANVFPIARFKPAKGDKLETEHTLVIVSRLLGIADHAPDVIESNEFEWGFHDDDTPPLGTTTLIFGRRGRIS
jgi:hypothetical protein